MIETDPPWQDPAMNDWTKHRSAVKWDRQSAVRVNGVQTWVAWPRDDIKLWLYEDPAIADTGEHVECHLFRMDGPVLKTHLAGKGDSHLSAICNLANEVRQEISRQEKKIQILRDCLSAVEGAKNAD